MLATVVLGRLKDRYLTWLTFAVRLLTFSVYVLEVAARQAILFRPRVRVVLLHPSIRLRTSLVKGDTKLRYKAYMLDACPTEIDISKSSGSRKPT